LSKLPKEPEGLGQRGHRPTALIGEFPKTS